jgi:hypothetical protein
MSMLGISLRWYQSALREEVPSSTDHEGLLEAARRIAAILIAKGC